MGTLPPSALPHFAPYIHRPSSMAEARLLWSASCYSYGVCVSEARGEVFASAFANFELKVFSLLSGRLLRTLTLPDNLAFNWGGLAYTHRDTLLIACDDCVAEVSPNTGASLWEFGRASCRMMEYVDCTPRLIAVTAQYGHREPHNENDDHEDSAGRIILFGWDGTELYRLRVNALGCPRGISIQACGSVVAVADTDNNRLVVFDLPARGVCRTVACPFPPWDVYEDDAGNLVSSGAGGLWSEAGSSVVLRFIRTGKGVACASSSSRGLVVVTRRNSNCPSKDGTIACYHGFAAVRLVWLRACACGLL